MPIIITVACIILLALALLLTRLRLVISFKDGYLSVKARALFLSFAVFDDKKEKINKHDFRIKKFRKRRDKVIKRYRIKKSPEGAAEKAVKKKKNSPLTMLRDLKGLLAVLIGMLGKHLAFDRFNIKIDVGGADAAKVATNYGYVIQYLQYLVTFLEHITNLDKTRSKSAVVNADFATEKWNATVDISISLRVIFALKIAIRALIGYIAYKNKRKPNKAEKQG